ncbi:hypothetical protein [Actomonas aquatica]|uniref:DUF4252 domain-containing protein n=1 Tax=Actomonas aquatica TaxID=2866162 RepID=A0ABZ1CCK9_9BACT|nr:hypothetical protein [Opitutus sp. WL0086]WRQ89003.1 hypothetical protein K1X11_006260 [Opitutus sp. WL0086]
MTTSASPSTSSRPARRGFRWLHWLFVMLAAMTVVAVVEAASMFRLSREAGELRSAIHRVVKGDATTTVQFSVGPGAIGLVRFVAGFVDDVPPEALRAMEAVHSASVGVYQLDSAPSLNERIAMMEVTAANMREDGWHRVVAVRDGDDVVMVFSPEAAADPDALELCLVVCSDDELVVVSANGRTEPLQAIAREHSREWREAAAAERF